jgi:hypothetical protein
VSASTPSWVGWLIGRHVSKTATLNTPTSAPATPVAFAAADGIELSFTHPVSVVDYTAPGNASRMVRLGRPAATVVLPVPLQAPAGTLEVAAAPLPWEKLAAVPSTVTWFAESSAADPMAVANPGPGSTTAAPDSPVTLTFSKPVSQVLGAARPQISPEVAGAWSEPNPNTLVFTPSGFGFGPGTTVSVSFDRLVSVVAAAGPQGAGLPTAAATDAYSFTTTPGSMLRLEQILADLHYLPLRFVQTPGQTAPSTFAEEVASMAQPLAGSFEWRWSSTPQALTDQWTVGTYNPLVRGALMAFDAATQSNFDGYQADDESYAQLANGPTWEALLMADLHHQLDPNPYSYVYVSQSLPESLTLWEDGSVVLTAAVNTGIPARPTVDGTFPIYVRYTFNYMSGFNPDGSYYHDPVYWINYFNGGDAVHGFYRASYGWPQSLGCVELPISTAQVAFNHLAIGDLVTVAG